MRDTFLCVWNWKYTNNVKFRKRRQQQGHVHKLTTELCKSVNQQYSIYTSEAPKTKAFTYLFFSVVAFLLKIWKAQGRMFTP